MVNETANVIKDFEMCRSSWIIQVPNVINKGLHKREAEGAQSENEYMGTEAEVEAIMHALLKWRKEP